MEILHLAEKRRTFAPSEERYKNPHAEAMKLRPLWSNYKPLSMCDEIRETMVLYNQAAKLAENEEEMENARRLIKKGLFMNPRYHRFYALRGDMFARQGEWSKAITSYENGRSMAKFDAKLVRAEMNALYTERLVECYTKRGDWYRENGQLSGALGDYEEVIVLRVRRTKDVQNKLLEILRRLDKYVLFCRYWEEFMRNANATRTSELVTIHAGYKIYLKEIAVARCMLYEALELNENNAQALELLQVVFSAGHTMATCTILWCLHGCYDKALVTTEKALDCNPSNPGFTLLKAIVLRLSGRLEEANSWLENVSKNFYKLLNPSRDEQESIIGKLTIGKLRTELTKQWYLIRYDMALECMLNDKLEAATRIIYGSKLTKYFAESFVLLGDGFFKRGNVDLALEMYFKYRERIRTLGLPASQRTIDVTERIIDILNDRAKIAVHKKRAKDAIRLSEHVLRILNEDRLALDKLVPHRGHALLQKARGQFQVDLESKERNKYCCESAADSLRFLRESCDTGFYRSLYGDSCIEDTIDRFAPKRKLPRSLKILMQYS